MINVEWCLRSESMLVDVHHLMPPNSKELEVTLSAYNHKRVSLLRLSGNTVEVTTVFVVVIVLLCKCVCFFKAGMTWYRRAQDYRSCLRA